MSLGRRVPLWFVLLAACSRPAGTAVDEATPPVEAPLAAPQPLDAPPPSTPSASRSETLGLGGTSQLGMGRLDTSRVDKTVGVVEVKREGPPRLLHAVRAAAGQGYDRVVFEFRDEVPGFHLEYVDRPIVDCGAGDIKPVEGDAWLEVRFSPANAHTEAGEPTIPERELWPHLTIVREIERTCDFEAVVTWVVGTASPNRYRAFELAAPPRLVIDIDR